MLLILMYHRVHGQERVAGALRTHLSYLKQHHPVVLPGDPLPGGETSVCLTFDDATADFYQQVYPLLRELELQAMVAVPTAYIAEDTADPADRRLAAQQQAVTRQHDFVVGFDAPNGSIRVHQDANNDGKIDAGERVRNWPLGDNVVFGRGGAPAFAIGQPAVTFTQVREGLPSVIFHRSGSASEYGGFYLTSRRSALGGLSRDARAIEVERATGRATWYRYVNQWSKDF